MASVGYSYDLGIITDPARTVSFTYTNGFLTAVPSFAGSISYHPNTMVNQVAHANGVTDTYGKDPNDMARPASISTAGSATNWLTGTYQYDGAGDVWTIGTDTYLYDLVTRLKEGNVGSVAQKQCAVFDAFGNILGLAQIASGGTCPTTGSSSIDASTNRFLSPVTYDAAGNETYRGGTTYTWDKFSQMATAIGTGINRAYLYTADGERIAERDNAAGTITVTVRDLSNKVLRIFAKSGGVWSWSKDYVYRDGSLLASVESAGTKHVHLDHLGTVRRITGTGTPAAVLASHDYFPFGLEATSPAQDAERMKYTGHERDAATALDSMHARHYNFAVGRFNGTDATNLRNPASTHDPTIPQAWNRYAYVRNRPSLGADPTGRDIWLTYRLPAGLFDHGHIVLQVVDHNSGEVRATWSFGPSSGLPPLAKYGAALFGISMPGEQTPDYLATHHNTRTAVALTDAATDSELAQAITSRIAANESYNYYLNNCATSTAQLIDTVTPFDLPMTDITPGEVFDAFSNMVYSSSPANAGVQAFVDQPYGPGPWLMSDPGVFTDALGNSVGDPDPR